MSFQGNVNSLLGVGAAAKSNLFTKQPTQQGMMPMMPPVSPIAVPKPTNEQVGKLATQRAVEIATEKKEQHKRISSYMKHNRNKKKGGKK